MGKFLGQQSRIPILLPWSSFRGVTQGLWAVGPQSGPCYNPYPLPHGLELDSEPQKALISDSSWDGAMAPSSCLCTWDDPCAKASRKAVHPPPKAGSQPGCFHGIQTASTPGPTWMGKEQTPSQTNIILVVIYIRKHFIHVDFHSFSL